MNIVMIMGHLGGDAETRFTSNGQKVTTFTVATNNRRGDTEETIWWRVTLWGERFDKMIPYLKKGTAVIVNGELKKPEIWTGQDGQPRLTLELTAEFVRFSPFGRSAASLQVSQQQEETQTGTETPMVAAPTPMDFGAFPTTNQDSNNPEDNIPF